MRFQEILNTLVIPEKLFGSRGFFVAGFKEGKHARRSETENAKLTLEKKKGPKTPGQKTSIHHDHLQRRNVMTSAFTEDLT